LAGERAIWLGEYDGKPLVVVHNPENHGLRLLNESGEIAKWSVSGNTSPLVAQETTSVFVFAGTTLWKAPIARGEGGITSLEANLESENSVNTMPPVQLVIKNHRLLLLGRTNEQWHVLEIHPQLFIVRDDHALSLPSGSDTVLRLAHTERWLALGATLPHGSRAVDVVAWDTAGRPLTLRTAPAVISDVANFPGLDALEIAPDDAQVFVCYNLPSFSNPVGARPVPSTQWLAIDTEPPRPAWPLEPHVTHLYPLPAHRRFEAIYQTENKAVHALTFPGFVVLDRPPLDLIPNCAAWAAVRGASGEIDETVILAAATDDRLLILRDGAPAFMTPLPIKTHDLLGVGALTAHSGRFLAIRTLPGLERESETVLVWECGSPPPLDAFPDPVSPKASPRLFPKAVDQPAK
jgi:hypothetical protein